MVKIGKISFEIDALLGNIEWILLFLSLKF
ncbi:hypothetical protein BPO_2208 [Bergeyella porcorum]|uniref:Uncharacterized protein n=1 Tax=Bergeyella porcorum TaxID=1735111 RepID=A0AAU0F663_9FLAO